MIKRLFFVVGNRFVDDPCFLNSTESTADQIRKILDEENLLIAIRDKKYRWADILPKLTKIIGDYFKEYEDKSQKIAVIALVHMRCFNADYNRNGEGKYRSFRRFERAESELLVEVMKQNGTQYLATLEIYGLHFEEETALYKVLKSGLLKPEEFSPSVIKVLESFDPAALFERLSVIKHRIVGLFLPLDLTLQNWAEGRDPLLRAEVDSRLPGKLAVARALVEGAEGLIDEIGGRADVNKVRELLQASQVDARDATSFHAWVNDLDQALDEVRKAVVL